LLQEPRCDSACFNGEVFEGGGGGKTPDSTHADTEERAQGEELVEILYETCTELEDADEDEVEDERPFTAVAIRYDAKYDL